MIQLVYASTAIKSFSTEELRVLLVRARYHNAAVGITGMLVHVDGTFLQVLEGEAEIVHRLFISLAADYRHHRILLLLMREIAERHFDASLGFFDASGRGGSLPGYRSATGFADLIGDPTSIVRVVSEVRSGRLLR